MKKNRITKLNKTLVELSNGDSFTIVHDLKMNGINSFDAALQNWLARTDDYSPESFIGYVKSKEPEKIFLTIEDYNEITKGETESATEEDYLAENN
jgi:hypothetical protein